MCRGHAHGEKEGVAAADHSIFVWRRIACRCCRHPCHLRVCRTIGTNGAWCAGVCYEVCGLVCGTLSTVPWGDGLAAWQSRSPSLEQCRAAAHPRARRLPPRVLTRTRPPKQCVVCCRQFATSFIFSFGGGCPPPEGVKKEPFLRHMFSWMRTHPRGGVKREQFHLVTNCPIQHPFSKMGVNKGIIYGTHQAHAT